MELPNSKENNGIYMDLYGLINLFLKLHGESELHHFIHHATQIIDLESTQLQDLIPYIGTTEHLQFIINLNSVLYQLLIYQAKFYKRITYSSDTFLITNTKLSSDFKTTDIENQIQTGKT